MKSIFFTPYARFLFLALLVSLLIHSSLSPFALAQSTPTAGAQIEVSDSTNRSAFRLETIDIEGGAQLLTIFGDASPAVSSTDAALAHDVPLVSVLRDTLGDTNPENDQLRYVWMHTYARPTFTQRMAAAIPFFYSRVGSRRSARGRVPAPVIDLAETERDVWERFFWIALQNVVLDPLSATVSLSARTYRHNANEHRKAHLLRALAVLSLFEAEDETTRAFTESEMREIQARLAVADSTFGGVLDDFFLGRVYANEAARSAVARGENWEMLRQRAEEEHLYFDPLEMPDGSATHALVWASRQDLTNAANRAREFNRRFLNFSNPWRDPRLLEWRGYTETWHFDAQNRRVTADSPSRFRSSEMIPLALYGLDHPRIPIILVDFRDGGNPRRRALSRRVLDDVARNILRVSRLGDLYYFLGRTVYDHITGKRAMDINQPPRVRAYSQLRLLLALSDSLEPQMRAEIGRRMNRVNLNPMDNSAESELRIAREQYSALVVYARRPDGLSRRLLRDRRAEMSRYERGDAERVLFRLANLMSFGLYTRREQVTPERMARLEIERRVAYHTRVLRDAASSSPVIEVARDIETVRRSLQFISDHGERANNRAARAVAQIFSRTEDAAARELCLRSLYRINSETAKSELVRIFRDERVEMRWRTLAGDYLRSAMREHQRIHPRDAQAIASLIVE
jgi:hypothetical protein